MDILEVHAGPRVSGRDNPTMPIHLCTPLLSWVEATPKLSKRGWQHQGSFGLGYEKNEVSAPATSQVSGHNPFKMAKAGPLRIPSINVSDSVIESTSCTAAGSPWLGSAGQ